MIYDEIFSKPLSSIKGIGAAKYEKLQKAGLATVYDMLFDIPMRYEDRRDIRRISELTTDGTLQGFIGRICSRIMTNRNGRKAWVSFNVSDGQDAVNCIFFNMPYANKIFKIGDVCIFWGEIKRGKRFTVINPVFDKYSVDKKYDVILPVYRNTAAVGTALLRSTAAAALDYVCELPEYLPDGIVRGRCLCGFVEAMRNIHFPESFECLEEAKRRLMYEEVFVLRYIMRDYRTKLRANCGQNDPKTADMRPYILGLPFALTRAQQRVWQETEHDLERPFAMNRLIQGDVGCGKSIVAYLALVKTSLSGYQAAMMAPTEILAQQLYDGFTELFDVPAALLTGSLKTAQKQHVRDEIASCDGLVVFGTHALLSETTVYRRLGLVITDEQHRFGVEQRKMLAQKSDSPDVLIMSATPIPRTLAMVIYGDTDISLIDELPPNRKPIKTYIVNEAMRERAYGYMVKMLNEGKRAYIVCPLIETDTESTVVSELGINAAEADGSGGEYVYSVEEIYERVCNLAKAHEIVRPVFVHGKMKKQDKDAAMDAFRTGEANVLIATTVVEVGVNVPEAALMIIENGERFGLSQLHQLRGRVGRSELSAECIIFDGTGSGETTERLKVMKQSCDGFYIAEKDLEQRGPGNFFGTDQHGLPPLKMSAFFQNTPMLEEVNADIEAVTSCSMTMTSEERAHFEDRIAYELKLLNGNNYFVV